MDNNVHLECCIICGLIPGCGNQFGRYIFSHTDLLEDSYPEEFLRYCKPPKDHTDETWSPFNHSDKRLFHSDLVLIGPFGSEHVINGNLCADEKHNDDFSNIRCLTGMKDDYKPFIKAAKGKHSLVLNSEDDSLDDISSRRPGRETLKHQRVQSGASEGIFIAHRQCWEILQGISSQIGKGKLTPRAFWLGAYRYKDAFPYVNTRLDNQIFTVGTNPWTQYGYLDFLEKFWFFIPELPPATDFEMQWTQALLISFETGYVDKEFRQELWTEMQAWIFVPPSYFPLQQSKIISETLPSLSHFEVINLDNSTSLKKLPIEILGLILTKCNINTALNFALTCKEMHQIVLPLLDRIALAEMQRDHPWMLPMTPQERNKFREMNAEQHEDNIARFLQPPVEATDETWSPLIDADIGKFHRDLVIIGPFGSENLVGDLLCPDESNEEDFSNIRSITGMREGVVGQHFSINKYGPSYILNSKDIHLDTVRFYRKERSQMSHWRVKFSSSDGIFCCHRQCWEILQGISNQNQKGKLTPRAFWQAAIQHKDSFPYRHISLEDIGLVIQGLVGTNPWTQYGDYDTAGGFRVLFAAENFHFRIRWREVMLKSFETGKVDKEFRKELWEKIRAWVYVPPSYLPFKKATIIRNNSTPPLRFKMKKFAFATSGNKFPVEILEFILLECSIESALNFALTCKRMRFVVLRVLERITIRDIQMNHPWMLPLSTSENAWWARRLKGRLSNINSPWKAYRSECSDPTNCSMRNTRRIYESAMSIYKDILDRKLLD